MVVPAVTRLALNVVGGLGATTGYAAGKLRERAGGGKAIDSAAFRAGFTSWMWSNGIFPEVEYEPLRECHIEYVRSQQGQSRPVVADDMTITPIIVSNHISYLDGPVLAALFKAPKIVAKATTREVPVFGKLMEEMEVVFVDREQSNSRQATLDAIDRHCKEWAPGRRPLLIFPEGTTTNGEGLLDFKRGAFVSGAPVRPVVIVYTGQFDPASTNYKSTEKGLEATSDVEWAAQFMGHYVHSMHVRVLPPYLPSADERADSELYARNVHLIMVKELERVREELFQHSWKAYVGRDHGGLGYRWGDLSAVVSSFAKQRMKELVSGSESLNCSICRQK